MAQAVHHPSATAYLKQGRLLFRVRAIDKGSPHPYIAARCETGKLQAKGEFTFTDGTRLEGTFLKPCTVRGR